MFFKQLCPGAPQNSVRGAKCPGGFPSHQNTIFLTIRTNILTFPLWQKASTGAGQPSAVRKQKGTGEGEDDVKSGNCTV